MQYIDNALLNGPYEYYPSAADRRCTLGGVRVINRVYGRSYVPWGEAICLSVTLVGTGNELFLSAITCCGKSPDNGLPMLFPFHNRFLKDLIAAVEKYEQQQAPAE